MKIFSTCVQCGKAFEVTTPGMRVCASCPPDYLDQLEAAFLAAVLAGDVATADALAVTLDQAAKASVGLLAAATAYARQGWPVFPCLPGDKRPATRHGFKDATTDTTRVDRWWTRHPDHNIGVATGHCFDVIDVDYTNRPDALDWWLTAKHDPEFEIDALATTPKGFHAYIKPMGGAGNASKLFRIGGIDYRGIGGYVVAPPSIRHDGGLYEWMSEPSPRIKRA